MNSGGDKHDYHQRIKNLAIASLCLSLLPFVLVPVAFILDNMDLIGWAAHDTLMFVGIPLPTVGAICGHVALKKMKARPETAGKYRRPALAGAIIGYGWTALCILGFAIFWFIVLPNAFRMH